MAVDLVPSVHLAVVQDCVRPSQAGLGLTYPVPFVVFGTDSAARVRSGAVVGLQVGVEIVVDGLGKELVAVVGWIEEG